VHKVGWTIDRVVFALPNGGRRSHQAAKRPGLPAEEVDEHADRERAGAASPGMQPAEVLGPRRVRAGGRRFRRAAGGFG